MTFSFQPRGWGPTFTVDIGFKPFDRVDPPIDAIPIIPITDESIAVHGEDEVFWMVYEPLFDDPDGFSDDWVCMGSWLKEADG